MLDADRRVGAALGPGAWREWDALRNLGANIFGQPVPKIHGLIHVAVGGDDEFRNFFGGGFGIVIDDPGRQVVECGGHGARFLLYIEDRRFLVGVP